MSAITTVAAITAITMLTTGSLLAGQVSVEAQRAAGAADAAALAAADAVSGAVIGEPCELAGEVARRNRATLVSCATVEFDAYVTVQVQFFGYAITARARAGPAA